MKLHNKYAVAVILAPILLVALSSSATAQSWTQLSPTGGPPPLRGGSNVVSVVADGNANLTMFGGVNTIGGNLNDSWVLSNSTGLGGTPTWTQLLPTGSLPPPRHSHAAVYDSSSNRMIIFGGCGGGCLPTFNDVWVLTNANGTGGVPSWIELSPSGGLPAGRQAMAAAYNPSTNRMIIFGGQDGGGFGGSTFPEVWVLTNANGLGGTPQWILLSTAGTTDPGQYGPKSFYDVANNRLTLIGGAAFGTGIGTNAVWVLSNADGTGPTTPTWTNLIPEGASGSPPDFGQASAPGYDPNHNIGMLAAFTGTDLWLLANANGLGGTTSWTHLFPPGGPSVGSSAGVYDQASNRLTALIVSTDASGATINQFWALTNANGIVTFAAFSAELEIGAGPPPGFETQGSFTLGTGSSGLNPPTQNVTLQIGSFSITIPAGSFVQDSEGNFEFEGTISGVTLDAEIAPLGSNSFSFSIEGKGVDLTGLTNPVTVVLTIGNNSGTTTVTAEFD